ncbi:MAG: hypothetical protein ACC655_04100 [Rhodothermia bacterium]
MKTISKLVLTVTMLAWTMSAAAQDSQHHGEQAADPSAQTDSVQIGAMPHMTKGGTTQGDMMQGDMMQGMHSKMIGAVMNDPLKRSTLLIQVLPTMKETLDLSDEQVAGLERIAQDYTQRKAQESERAENDDQQIQDLLGTEAPDPAQLKTLLRSAATVRADIAAMGYEAAVAMKGELSDEQRETLVDMTPMEIHHYMMTNLTMMEMMKAMHGDEMGKMHGGDKGDEMGKMHGGDKGDKMGKMHGGEGDEMDSTEADEMKMKSM